MTQDRAGKVCGASLGHQSRNEEPETGKAKPRVKARSSGTGLGGASDFDQPCPEVREPRWQVTARAVGF